MKHAFRHAGDRGDCIYALPTIRAMGGGILYLDPLGGLNSPLVKWQGRTSTRLNAVTIALMTDFLEQQPYIEKVVQWTGENALDLDQFRQNMKFGNIADAHLEIFGLPKTERDTPWLTVDKPIPMPAKPIVIHRNLRYCANDAVWEANLPEWKDHAVFVGHPLEHQAFEHVFEHKVDYVHTETLLDLARIIAGCGQFIGNEGLPRAIAEGFKKEVIVENGRLCPNTIFHRPGAQYV